jgi:hypothetical protein
MEIVIVDDDPVQCRLLKGMLQDSATKRKAATVAMPDWFCSEGPTVRASIAHPRSDDA